MLSIGLLGSTGKVGTEIVKEIIHQQAKFNLKQALVNNNSKVTSELKSSGAKIIYNIEELSGVDVVIDFSNHQLSLKALHMCANSQTPIVIGTTGFSQEEKKIISISAQQIPILISPNMSLSVNLLFKLIALTAKKLPEFEAEIIEAHHRYKKDAPSGTAIKIGEIIAKSRGIDFNTHAKYTRYAEDHSRRNPQDIGFAVIRGGDIVGNHEACFINDGEILSLTSTITNRSSFARGALLAANFIYQKPHGLYNMSDVLQI